jgi:hypothetical protein
VVLECSKRTLSSWSPPVNRSYEGKGESEPLPTSRVRIQLQPRLAMGAA